MSEFTVTQSISLDVLQANTARVVLAKQQDYASRFLCVKITQKGTAMNIPESTQILFGVRRSDGQRKAFYGNVNSDGTANIKLPSWLLEITGKHTCDVGVLKDDDLLLSTMPFTIEVVEAPCTDDVIVEEEDPSLISIISSLPGRVETLEKKQEQALSVIMEYYSLVMNRIEALEEAVASVQTNSVSKWITTGVSSPDQGVPNHIQYYNTLGQHTFGVRFKTDGIFRGIKFKSPNTTISTYSLYRWNRDYETTVASVPIKTLVEHAASNNPFDRLVELEVFVAAGEYLFVFSGPEEYNGTIRELFHTDERSDKMQCYFDGQEYAYDIPFGAVFVNGENGFVYFTGPYTLTFGQAGENGIQATDFTLSVDGGEEIAGADCVDKSFVGNEFVFTGGTKAMWILYRKDGETEDSILGNGSLNPEEKATLLLDKNATIDIAHYAGE